MNPLLPLARRCLALLAAALALCVPAAPAPAQPDSKVAVSVHASKSAVTPGDQLTLAVIFDHEEGWHVQTQSPQAPPELEGFTPFPTTIDVRSSQPVTIGPVQWPQAKIAEVNFTGTPVLFEVFGGRAIAFVPLLIPASASGELRLDVKASFQACNDRFCMQPEDQTLTLTLPLRAIGEAIEPVSAEVASFFAGFDPTVFSGMSDLAPTTGQPEPPAPQAAPAGPRFLWLVDVPKADSVGGVLVIALLGVVGGLALNLTPCVLPVLPIKVLTITQHAGTPGRALYLGLWMAGGVVAFWASLAVPVLAISTFTDPSQLFGIWWVTFGIGLVIAVMAAGIMGLFTLNLPQGVYMLNPKADTAWGSFLFGVLTGVLGLPCFGFVAGALLPATAGAPAVVTAAVFTSLGVGMALPYLVLALKPAWVERIPRTGPASELVKQVMGLLLLAAAAYFIGAGLIALVQEKPYLGKLLHWWAVAGFAAAAGLWLAWRTFAITRSPIKRAVFGVLAVFVAGAALLFTLRSTASAAESWRLRQAELAGAEPGMLITTTWSDYSDAVFERARAENYIVVVDFTADWCINCKALHAAFLATDPVKSDLRRGDVVALTADLTSKAAPGWAKLRALGQVGIPLLAVFSPGKDEPWLANSYDSATVMAALRQARSAREALPAPGGQAPQTGQQAPR